MQSGTSGTCHRSHSVTASTVGVIVAAGAE